MASKRIGPRALFGPPRNPQDAWMRRAGLVMVLAMLATIAFVAAKLVGRLGG